MRKSNIIFVGTIGTLLEWAEFTLYGYLAMHLGQLFFPSANAHVQLINTFGIFAAGYLTRPIGAMIFGYVGDHFGRKPALMASMWLMGLATLGMALIPTYQSIGIAAPLLMLSLRLLQGMAVAGEFNGASIFLIEHLGSKRPCLAGSLVSCAAALGMVSGGFFSFLISLPMAPEWAWRLPFLLGAVGCVLGSYIRHQVEEAPDFIEMKSQQATLQKPFVKVMHNYIPQMIKIGALAAFVGVFVYLGNIYFIVFLKSQLGLAPHYAALLNTAAQLCVAGGILLSGFLADRHKQALLQIKLGLGAAILFSPFIYFLPLKLGSYGIAGALCVYVIINSIVCGPLNKVMVDWLPAKARYSAISISWSVAVALFSGSAPIIAQSLNNSGYLIGPGIYISAIALMALLGISLSPSIGGSREQYNPVV